LFPSDPGNVYDPPDLRPKASNVLVDAAQLISNVNEPYEGRGPDIGAYERNQELPVYGPRP
jgi:hypothetical protein